MKSVKIKLISSLAAASLMVSLGTASVFAKETNSKIETALVNQQQRIENRQERQQAKDAMLPKKDTIKQNHATNEALRKEISQKRASVKSMRQDIKSNNKQLTSDDLSKIQEQLKIIDGDVSSLESLRGTINTAYEKVKDDMKNKNYQDAQSQLDTIISIQNTRTTDLTKLNTDMDALISILQSAEANAKTSPSSGTSSTT
ncbi:hypothetical protein ACJDU8_06630 [Clostridium sp. WILCCON 0269]|uniref:Uncharacterized protein n=1 Tax=Candidatus Clostridium eludens TaxID=3381663 RepID=A0ABW8SHS2_9CLOT